MSEETAAITFWRTFALSAAGIVVALCLCMYKDSQNYATKADIAAASQTQEHQLNDIQRTLGEHSSSIGQLNVDVGRISEHLGIPAHPNSRYSGGN